MFAESVTVAHPDKLADRISDAILDAHLARDPQARVACETLLVGQNVVIAGEITSTADVDCKAVVRRVIDAAGFGPEYNGQTVRINNLIQAQCPEIRHAAADGAGDQGVIVGYAIAGNRRFLPLAFTIARDITDALTTARVENSFDGLGPDGKALVNVRDQVADVVVSTQHKTDALTEVRRCVAEQIVEPVLDRYNLDAGRIDINPGGSFLRGGPLADTGLTGRKLMVDTYGGLAPHGGGAFSGKDATKVDRSAAYALRHQAKGIVSGGLAPEVTLRAMYAIGDAHPRKIEVEAPGATSEELERIQDYVGCTNMSLSSIVLRFELDRPIYEDAVLAGHFGNNSTPWEQR